jgi:hypothetical protein
MQGKSCLEEVGFLKKCRKKYAWKVLIFITYDLGYSCKKHNLAFQKGIYHVKGRESLEEY